MCNHINRIIELARQGDVHGMIYAMKEFVPEYKSQHSKFEAIDKELEGETVDSPAAPDTHQLSAE